MSGSEKIISVMCLHKFDCCRAGLQPGDIVTHANNEAVRNSQTIYKILEQPGPIDLQIVRRGKVLHIKVNPEDL